MSAVIVILTPVVISAWPMIASAVASAAAAAGFTATANAGKKAMIDKKQLVKPSVDIEVPNVDVVAETLAADAQITVERKGVRVTFVRDARGRFQTTVEGDLPKEELRNIGQDLAGRVVQQYVYQRLTQELAAQGFSTVNEELGADEAIRIHVRRFKE